MNASLRNKQDIWIVTDRRGGVHARIKGGTRETAQRMAAAFFPEEEGQLLVWHHDRTSPWIQSQAKRAVQLTPEMCIRYGIFASTSIAPRSAGGGQ